jgi:hypothetical protein
MLIKVGRVAYTIWNLPYHGTIKWHIRSQCNRDHPGADWTFGEIGGVSKEL